MRRTLLLFTGIALIFPYMMAQFAVWDEVLSPGKVIGKRDESGLSESRFRSADLSGTQHKYKIYDISGTLIWSGNDISSCQEMPAGTPVVIQYTEDGEIRTVKHIKH